MAPPSGARASLCVAPSGVAFASDATSGLPHSAVFALANVSRAVKKPISKFGRFLSSTGGSHFGLIIPRRRCPSPVFASQALLSFADP